MIVGILQPGYLPWLGFFEQIHKSDLFVFYDDVKYDKNGWRNRNRIKTANGTQWLTVPVILKNENKPSIKEIKINNQENWRKKHLASISANYSKAAFFSRYFPLFNEVYIREWKNLIDLDVFLILMICDILGLKREFKFSSELKIGGEKNSRLVNICKYFGATRFYEGQAGKNYINIEMFNEAGIEVEFQDYSHPEYEQLYGDFVPYLSIIDLLFNEGDESLKIITKEKKL